LNILEVVITSMSSILVLFVLTKLMGYRQVSQLSMFDYINGITIGSIAAQMATNPKNDWINPIIAMTVYALVTLGLSVLSSKCYSFRTLLSGKPIILLYNGRMYRENFKSARLDLEEFLLQCRLNGYFDISALQSAILEVNGKISFLPLSQYRTVTPNDLSLTPRVDTPVSNLIIDGNLMKQNIEYIKKDETWIKNQLKNHGISKISEVFLATYDNRGQFTIYLKNGKKAPPTFYQ
jgi:uncharacterized membrane protein YcaP (DUF421 family)